MNETNFEIVLDVLAREIDMLRYQVKAAGEGQAKMRNRMEALEEENAKLRDRADVLMAENAKLRAMIGEGRENHE